MVTYLLLLLIVLTLQTSTASFRFKRQRKQKKCEAVRAPICLKVNTGYNSTSFPNYFKHRSQEEAISEMNSFEPLIKMGCSKHLATFLCSLYVPLCAPGFLVLPCRALCLHAMYGCRPVMEKYKYNWNFNCTKYPDGEESNMCLGKNVKLPESMRVKGKVPKKEPKQTLEGKDKIRSRKGWVIGHFNETLNLMCSGNKTIHVKKVRTPSTAKCCPTASRAVISAMCSGNVACSVIVSKATLGAHCKAEVSKLSIRYRCVQLKAKKSPCAD